MGAIILKTKESKYSGIDGIEMVLKLWRPDSDTRAIILGIHGLGGHSGIYSFLGEYFAEHGYTFIAPDMRAFGQYPGRKGHVESFDEYNEDINLLVKDLMEKYSGKPFFLLGHSLGGLHVIRYVVKYPNVVDGIVIPCPAVSERLQISSGVKLVMRFLSALNVKKYFSTGLEFELLSRNPEVVKRHTEDPLRFDLVTPRFGSEGLKAREKGFKMGPRITLPVFLPQSGDDLILVPEKNKEFFDTIASADKTWKLYDDLYHEPFEELGGEQMLQDILAWLEERIN